MFTNAEKLVNVLSTVPVNPSNTSHVILQATPINSSSLAMPVKSPEVAMQTIVIISF